MPCHVMAAEMGWHWDVDDRPLGVLNFFSMYLLCYISYITQSNLFTSMRTAQLLESGKSDSSVRVNTQLPRRNDTEDGSGDRTLPFFHSPENPPRNLINTKESPTPHTHRRTRHTRTTRTKLPSRDLDMVGKFNLVFEGFRVCFDDGTEGIILFA